MVIVITKQSLNYVWSKGKDGRHTNAPQLFFISNQIMYFHLENSISWSPLSYFMTHTRLFHDTYTPNYTSMWSLLFLSIFDIYAHFLWRNSKSRLEISIFVSKFHIWYIINISHSIYLFVFSANFFIIYLFVYLFLSLSTNIKTGN